MISCNSFPTCPEQTNSELFLSQELDVCGQESSGCLGVGRSERGVGGGVWGVGGWGWFLSRTKLHSSDVPRAVSWAGWVCPHQPFSMLYFPSRSFPRFNPCSTLGFFLLSSKLTDFWKKDPKRVLGFHFYPLSKIHVWSKNHFPSKRHLWWESIYRGKAQANTTPADSRTFWSNNVRVNVGVVNLQMEILKGMLDQRRLRKQIPWLCIWRKQSIYIQDVNLLSVKKKKSLWKTSRISERYSWKWLISRGCLAFCSFSFAQMCLTFKGGEKICVFILLFYWFNIGFIFGVMLLA